MSFASVGWLSVAAYCGVLALAGPAQAFSDPASFNASPVAAGGGGRYFTGSPADGYTCKVCHEGGAEPKASVLGLPLSGYDPGKNYEITINWPERFEKVTLAVELTDSLGKAAGRLRLPAPTEIKAPEFCDPASDQVLAAQLSEPQTGRQVINVPDCGSKRVRFLWTAPTTDLGQVWFAGSMVSSDGKGDPDHDGVTDFGRVLGSQAVASETTAQCTVATEHLGRARANWLSPTLMALAGCALELRRRERQRVRPRTRVGCDS